MAMEEETTLASSWKFLRFIKVHVLECVSVNFCFFFLFGVGLGAVLVVHILNGFPDKKLARRDLKFFAKSFK